MLVKHTKSILKGVGTTCQIMCDLTSGTLTTLKTLVGTLKDFRLEHTKSQPDMLPEEVQRATTKVKFKGLLA